MAGNKIYKKVMTANVEIKRIMSEGGVLWEKMFSWKKYDLERESLGYFTNTVSDEVMKERYPRYVSFVFKSTGYGTYEVFGERTTYMEIITSDNENDYPIKGVVGAFYYEFIG